MQRMTHVATVAEHYAAHLAPVYEWLAGGLEAAVTRASAELADVQQLQRRCCRVVDLGAGFGAHSLALARAGHSVLALDSSALLLERLRQAAAGLAITGVEADLLEFPRYLEQPAEVILCMGDTLTHLPEQASIHRLCDAVAAALGPGGVFVTSFRDYSQALTGQQRFIPVRSDAQRILTCFLEFQSEHVVVHDLLHERAEADWTLRVSAYPKLRLVPSTLAAQLTARGLLVQTAPGMAGMIRVLATRAG